MKRKNNCILPNTIQDLDRNMLISPKEVVFISGPMTGYENFNRAEFFRMQEILSQTFGCLVLNPGRHEDGKEYEWYMDQCAEDIQKCTTVVFLNKWQESPGAKREFILAHKLRKWFVFAEQVEHFLKIMENTENE